MPKGIPKNKEEKLVNLEDEVMILIDKVREGTNDRRFTITTVFNRLIQRPKSSIKNFHVLEDIFQKCIKSLRRCARRGIHLAHQK